ncbi:MAG: thiamine phosphate synthase [wastewater metagenome]|nr:thiamine phosphate synthase [Candidatus Loosdrechtia aerotolerans]
MTKKHSIHNLFFTFITDRNLCKRSLFDTVVSVLKGGVKTVQMREKDLTTDALHSLARELRKITLDFKANLIINDRVDIALAVEADGVHLGWQSLPYPVVRKLLGREKLIGVSTHNSREALQARDNQADYITFGPIFPTPSKAGLLEPTGPDIIKKLKSEIQIPIIALGGIHEKDVETVMTKGADGIAVISSITLAGDPEDTARRICQKIEMTKKLITL